MALQFKLTMMAYWSMILMKVLC